MHSIFLPAAKASRHARGTVQITASPPRVEPAKLSEWPWWSFAYRILRKKGETGLGDTMVRLIGPENSEKFKKRFRDTFGKDCGCTRRQRWLNQRFPYRSSTPAAPPQAK